jgi:hypothetical protein
MTDAWPQVSVLLVTYKRQELALRTLRGVAKQLEYPGALHYHIADDGSGGDHIERLVAAAWQDPRTSEVTWTDTMRAGVGRSMNLGQAECWQRSDFVLWLEDDWELQAQLNLRACVRVLEECQDCGMIRLGYLQTGMTGTLRAGAGELWWRLSWDSDDNYIFTGHASLRHRRFADAYGRYGEGLAPGATEADLAYRIRMARGPVILWPGWVGCWGPFGHIGGVSLGDLMPGQDWQEQETRQISTAGIGLAPEERAGEV